MGRNEQGKTKVGMFLQGIGRSDILEKVVNAGGAAITCDFLGAVKALVVKDKGLTIDQKKSAGEFIKIDEEDLKAFELEIKDRSRATKLFSADSVLQKVYAITFLVSYVLIAAVILYGCYLIMAEDLAVKPLVAATVGGIEGRMSMKIGTVTDFLFGGSLKKSK